MLSEEFWLPLADESQVGSERPCDGRQIRSQRYKQSIVSCGLPLGRKEMAVRHRGLGVHVLLHAGPDMARRAAPSWADPSPAPIGWLRYGGCRGPKDEEKNRWKSGAIFCS